ncbi:hypothetical protein DIPPA_27407 [Diplonema papillatum]|nr:hypothetical protein DIPPA_27407 [Diplonema papillatum]
MAQPSSASRTASTGATRDLLEKGAITGYQQGLVRAVIANAVHTGKRWEQATCRFCDAGVPEDEQHMWWDCVKWRPWQVCVATLCRGLSSFRQSPGLWRRLAP